MLYEKRILADLLDYGIWDHGKLISDKVINSATIPSLLETHRLVFSNLLDNTFYYTEYDLSIFSWQIWFAHTADFEGKDYVVCDEIGVVDYYGGDTNKMLLSKKMVNDLRSNHKVVGRFGKATEVSRISKIEGQVDYITIVFEYVGGGMDGYYTFSYRSTPSDMIVTYDDVTEYGQFVICNKVKRTFTVKYDWKPVEETPEDIGIRRALQSFRLEQLAKEIHANAVAKGFWESDRSVGESIALVHAELSEALEAARNNFPKDSHVPEFGEFETELADAIIRILDMAGGYNVDVVSALLAKVEYNKNRPHKHGKEF